MVVTGAAALTGDHTPHRLRAMMIMATFSGAPLGGFLGGQIVAAGLLRSFPMGELRCVSDTRIEAVAGVERPVVVHQ
jgi:MFS family permease